MRAIGIPAVLETKSALVVAMAVLVATVGIGGAAVGVGPSGALQIPSAQQQEQPGTTVALQPESATIDAGSTTTYDVVVENAAGGVGAYDFTVSLADPSVASITDVTVQGSPADQTTDVSIAGDGSAADVKAALADTSDSGSVTIATVTVSGDAAGSSDLGLSVSALGTEAGESYTVTETTGASITVEAPEEPEPEPDPATFEVSNLQAPDSATQGDAIDVSAEITNGGDEEATQDVEFRLDTDGDGTLQSDEALTSQEVTLDGGDSETVSFEALDTSGLDAGEYTHGVFTEDDSATATIAIEAADSAPETRVRLSPSSRNVDVGDTTTYDVVVVPATGGVGAYDFSVGLADPSVASITDVSTAGNPATETTDVTIASDRSSADVMAALADTNDNGRVTIATVTVTGDSAGSSDIGLSVEALGTEAGESYTLTDTAGASITVREAPDPDPDPDPDPEPEPDPEPDPDPEPEPDPATFEVSNLQAPDSATQGDAIDVSAEVSNDGDEEATQTVEFRLDLDGDGTLQSDEALTSQEVTLDGGDSETVSFEALDTSGLDAGEYTHGVFTEDDSATATITIEATGGPADDLETAVRLDPSSATVDVDGTETYDVVVTDANGGVGAYDFSVGLADPSVASITDASVGGDPSSETTAVSIDDGATVDVQAALADTSDSGSVIIGTVTVRGDAAGSSDLDLSVEALGTEDGESYTVTDATGASITVEAPEESEPEPEPDPANFDVSNLQAPDSATQGDAIDVSAEITNDGDQEATQDVEFRVDLDGDGTLQSDETLTSQELTLESGDSETVTFAGIDTSGLDTGDYQHGVFTEDDSATASITVDSADESDDSMEYTPDEIAHAKYDAHLSDLSDRRAIAVEAIAKRQPFPDGTHPSDIKTREEIAQDCYGMSFDELTREQAIETQNAYDAQFGDLPSDPAYSPDDIAHEKFDVHFKELSTHRAVAVQSIYNRQPFTDGTGPSDYMTRDEIAQDCFEKSFDELNREQAIDTVKSHEMQFESNLSH